MASPFTIPSQEFFNENLTGSGRRSQAAKMGDIISVLDFFANGVSGALVDPTGVLDSTLGIQAADAAATGKMLLFPAGTYKYTGPGTTYTALAGAWVGQGDSGDPSGTNGAILKFSGANGGNPYVAPPRTTENMTFDGVDKTGKGLVMGTEGLFTGHQRWRNLVVRNFSTGIKCYNFFNVAWENISIQSNSEGVRIDPLNQPGVNGGDNGYFTSTHWKNIYIADNTSFGLLVNTPLGTKNWVLDNVVIERNGASGTFQASLTTTEFVANGLYMEGTSSQPAIKTSNATLTIVDGYFNGTGGIDAQSAAIRLDFSHVLMATATDVIAGMSALSNMDIRNGSVLQTDVRATIGGRAKVENSDVAGVAVSRQATTIYTTPTYGATVAIDASRGNLFVITATNNTAFTISNPTNGTQGQSIWIIISNTSGGALGAATWSANFKMGAAWTQPATGFQRCIQFVSSGATNWIETFRSAADVAN